MRLRFSAITMPSSALAAVAVPLLAVLLLTRTTVSVPAAAADVTPIVTLAPGLRLEVVARGLSAPRAIASVSADRAYTLGPDGKLYLGEVGRISRFDLNKPAFVREKVIWAVRWVFVAAADGILWVADDRNGMVRRLTRTS